jgi:hypothetical protein
LKKVWDSKTGTSGEINLILINLLQTFDIDAVPMLVAERNYGKVDPKIPFIDRFNKTVAYVNADGKNFILDATQKFCPVGLTPYPLLNTYGLIIDKKTTGPLNIKANDEDYKSSVTLHATLDNTGLFKGEAIMDDEQYAKQAQSELIAKGKKEFIKDYETSNAGISIDSIDFKNLDNNSNPLIQNIKFSEQFDNTAGFVLLNYNLFTGLAKNPFTQDERFTNVNFGYPYKVSLSETIDLPDSAKIEGIPMDKKLISPDGDMSISRQIKRAGNTLQINIDFLQTVTLVPYDNYEYLKEFYKQMVGMLNEPITVKLKNN